MAREDIPRCGREGHTTWHYPKTKPGSKRAVLRHCAKCRVERIERQRELYHTAVAVHPDPLRAVLEHYGGKCIQCGTREGLLLLNPDLIVDGELVKLNKRRARTALLHGLVKSHKLICEPCLQERWAKLERIALSTEASKRWNPESHK